MQPRIYSAALAAALMLLPRVTTAQQANPVAANPVADAFRDYARESAKNLMAAAEEFPADKFSYKPTPAQMSCGTIGGMKAPTRAKVAGTDTKEALVSRLRETFAFCDQALASLNDSNLGEALPFFGGRKMSRAGVIMVTTGDWADHYSQYANYLRLNSMLPPTAKKPAM